MDCFEYAICHYLALRDRHIRNNYPVIKETKKERQKRRRKMAKALRAQDRKKEMLFKQYQALAEAAQKKEQEEKEWQEKKEQIRLQKEKEESVIIKIEEDEPKIKIEKIDDPEDNTSENKHVDLNTPIKKSIVHQETQTEDTIDSSTSMDVDYKHTDGSKLSSGVIIKEEVDCKPLVPDYPEEKVDIRPVYKVIPITFCEPVKTTLILHHKDPRRKLFTSYDNNDKYLPVATLQYSP